MNFNTFKNTYENVPVEIFQHSVPEKVELSIMVQTYNHENYIRNCLDSLLSQETDFRFEILLGEDFSKDNTRAICKEYALKHPTKIRLFLHKQQNKISVNGTLTGNFNAFYNFYSSNGKFIAFCEGDDLWNDPKKLQKQVDLLKDHSKFAMCFHAYQLVDENLQVINAKLFPEQVTNDVSAIDLKESNKHPLLSTVCFKKKFQILPTEALEVVNVDTFLLSLIGFYGAGKFNTEIVPSLYRVHDQGTWSKIKNSSKLLNKINTYHKIQEYYRTREFELSKVFLNKKKLHMKMYLYASLKTGNFKSSLNLLRFK